MNFNLVILIVFYWLIICSVVGYGLILSKYFFKEKENYNFGYLGIYGLIILILYSYIINFAFSPSLAHNIILFSLGFANFIFFIKEKFNKINIELKKFFLIFLILFIAILISKTHDDFSYYHFPYTYSLINNDFIVGIGILNHGFRTPSSIFYFNSLLYLPLINYNLFHLTPILFIGFANFILINFIFNNLNKYNYIFFLSLLSFGFINIFFYRISEHGTDRSALILLFLIVIEIMILINKKLIDQQKINHILLLIALTITLKAFYFLYLIILIPIFLYLIEQKKIFGVLKLLFFRKTFLILSLMCFMVIFVNILNTGCAIYPVHFTCLDNFSWTISNQEVIKMNNWYEQWSKAGAGPNFRVENPEHYIKGFNWVSHWIDKYFFTKGSDFIFGILFLISVIYFYLIKGKTKYTKIEKIKFGSIYFIILCLTFEWFYNHPALRYGGYTLICLILFIPASIIFNKYNLNKSLLKIRTKKLLLIILIIFFGRNVDRIYYEVSKYGYNPLNNPFYNLVDHHYRIDKQIEGYLNNYENCQNNSLDCNKEQEIKIKKINNIIIISR